MSAALMFTLLAVVVGFALMAGAVLSAAQACRSHDADGLPAAIRRRGGA